MATTAEQQLALELINQVRLNPENAYDNLVTNATPQVQNALNYFDVDLAELASQFDAIQAVSAIAWSDTLANSASNQNDLMNQYDQQSHFLPGQENFVDRFTDAGYDMIQSVGENIFAYANDPFYAHAGFYIDWGDTETGIQTPAGHRNSIMSSSFTEVGIGWTAADPSNNNVGPFLTTQHFGTTFDYDAQLLGVVIDDLDNDDFYDIGEGMDGVTIAAVGTSGEGTFVTTSWASGGYQMVLPNGIYEVTFSGGGLIGSYSVTVTMGGENLKLDAEADDAVSGGLVLVGDDDHDTLTGSAENDEMSGGAGRDVLTGGFGEDMLDGGKGRDTLNGDEDNDILIGGSGKDFVYGGDGDDTLEGDQHGDALYGGAGADSLNGGISNDKLYGGTGNDELIGGTGQDKLSGGDGDDTLYGDDNADILGGGNGNDTLYGGTAADNMSGGTGDDSLFGGAGRDILNGNRGADSLYGGDGIDVINGGTGDDLISGGDRDDILDGGSGVDTFIFAIGDDNDTILNLEAIDTIQISTALANGQSTAQIAASAIVTAGSALIEFASGDTITLDDFSDVALLEDILQII